MLAFGIVNIHLCPGQNIETMKDMNLDNSYWVLTCKPQKRTNWGVRFLSAETAPPHGVPHLLTPFKRLTHHNSEA